jgi:hypothetical protein
MQTNAEEEATAKEKQMQKKHMSGNVKGPNGNI